MISTLDASPELNVHRGPATPAVIPASSAVWHILQYSDVLDLEFATELSRDVPTILWKPDRSLIPLRPHFRESEQKLPGSELRIRSFPLARGYARAPLSKLVRIGPQLVRRLLRRSSVAAEATLVCTTPYFAPVAELWPGPVVYWLTDLMIRYDGAAAGTLLDLDRKMCQVATLVCPASPRLAEYLHRDARCALRKIVVLPNATREANLLQAPVAAPDSSPLGAIGNGGPIAGVLGHLSDNMDWVLLEQTLRRTPWLTWALVGPSHRPVEDDAQGRAFDAVRANPRAHFLGFKPYGELWRYARAFSVAVLPYKRREPTFSGSSTRFYEHLAARHPILATPCVEELRHKEPLLKLVRTADQTVEALDALRATGFEDGQRQARWEAGLKNTWRVRAAAMQQALHERVAEGVSLAAQG